MGAIALMAAESMPAPPLTVPRPSDTVASMIELADIEAARDRIRGAIYCSPCPASETLGELTGTRCHVKLENLQMTGSFKERGALSKLLTLDPAERARGVVAASAGNHGLAVAFHAQRLGMAATIVMPEWAPLIKVTSCRRYGATVVLAGQDFDEAYDEARRREAPCSTRRSRRPGSGWPSSSPAVVVAAVRAAGYEVAEAPRS